MISTTKRLTSVLGATAILAGIFFLSYGPSLRAQSEQSSIGLEGTWRVTVTQRVCQTGAPIGNPFRSLLTFARGGTMTGTTASSLYLPGQRSSDFGVWSQSGRDYSAFDESFILFTGNGLIQGTQTLRHSISLTADRNGFTDVASVQFFDVNGNPAPPTLTAPGCATAVGQRLQ